MTRLSRIMLCVGAGIAVLGAGFAYSAVRSDYDFLETSLQPKVLDRAVWCWQDDASRAEIAASESRRDAFVVRAALLGQRALRAGKRPDKSVSNAASWMNRLDHDTDRLDYVYGWFWPAADRKKLFDHVAASRPVCSPTFGPDAKAPVTRSAG